MKIKDTFRLLLFTSGIIFTACEPDEVVTEVIVNQGGSSGTGGDPVVEESPYKTSGFVAASILSTPTSFSYFTNYTEEMPSGEQDLTQSSSSSFSGYYPQTVYKNFGFGSSLDSDNLELNRYAVDNETGKVVKAGSIPLAASLSQVLILDDETAVYTIFNTPSLFVFNPTTMQFVQEIPMPQAVQLEEFEDQANSYFHIVYRPQDNKVFLPLISNSALTPPFFEGVDIHVEIVDMGSLSWEKTTIFNGATYPLTRGMENPMVDEFGNIYLLTQGQYSLDFQFGPTAPPSSRPQILKIPAGSTDFDPTYAFNPVDYIGFSTSVAQLCTGSIYYKDGIAYAAMTAEPDVPRVNELLAKLGAGTITEEEFNELAALVTNSPNMKWSKIDLNAQTAEIIGDIPTTAGFTYPFSYKYQDKLYFQVFDPESGVNGYYEHDPAMATSSNVYNITSGGVATQFVILQE
ncbi:MAG: hypothetical protein AAGB24_08085 [Bacteroidota bacterium]